MSKLKKEDNASMIYRSDLWADELETLYTILRSTELEETTKWGGPVFTLNGKNVIGVGGFKSYFGLWFYQGVFLKDEKKLLVNASQGKTKAMRQLRFTSKKEIDIKLIKSYIKEAIENAKADKELKPEKKPVSKIPIELESALKNDLKAKRAFESLTPFKQKEYIEYINDAKQEKTKISRTEKSILLIKEGMGLNDKYR